jgi:hypothetical protein
MLVLLFATVVFCVSVCCLAIKQMEALRSRWHKGVVVALPHPGDARGVAMLCTTLLCHSSWPKLVCISMQL